MKAKVETEQWRDTNAPSLCISLSGFWQRKYLLRWRNIENYILLCRKIRN